MNLKAKSTSSFHIQNDSSKNSVGEIWIFWRADFLRRRAEPVPPKTMAGGWDWFWAESPSPKFVTLKSGCNLKPAESMVWN